jgi:undecaprenyl diphosphate synthase
MDNSLDISVGVIMDGNRRWAKALGKEGIEGHSKGYEVFKNFLNWARDAGVKTVYVYAFSEENWKRSGKEVSFLISLIHKTIKDELDNFKDNTKVKFAGSINKFPEDIYNKMLEIEKKTELNTDFNLVLCVSYGGRQELVDCFNKIITKNPNIKNITVDDISQNLYSASFKDPDLIIRTSGEQRLSGFLPWQSVYSEFFFTKTMWPDFTKEEFLQILDEYKNRERRLGK